MSRRSRCRDEQGAVALVVALVTVAVVIPIAAMGVDLGMQRVARRDMQAIADMVALDMARHLDGRKYTVIKDAWKGGIRRSIARNLNLSPQDEAAVSTGSTNIKITDGDDGVTEVARVSEQFVRGGDELVVQVTAGRLDSATGEFEAITDLPHQIPSAVRVVTSTSVDFAFSSGRGGASRSAIATADPLACHKIGSWGADLRTSHSVLDGLLSAIDAGIDLEAVHYDALASAQLTLADLFAEVAAGTPEQVLGAQVSLAHFLDATVAALPADSAAIEILEARVGDTLSATLAAQTITLGELVSLSGDPDVALAGSVNVLDLVQGAIFAANGTNAIAIPGLEVSVPGMVATGVRAHVVQQPQIACGFGSTAKTSQISLELETELDPLVAHGRVSVEVQVAQAEATLDRVACTAQGPQSLVVDLTTPRLAHVDVDLDAVLDVPWPLPDLPLAGADISSTPTSRPDQPYVLALPAAYDTPRQTDESGEFGLPSLAQSNLHAAGIPLGVLSPLLLPLDALVAGLEQALTQQVFPALGLDVAGADLYAVRTPDCVAPNLRG